MAKQQALAFGLLSDAALGNTKKSSMMSSHQILVTDELNVIPFEDQSEELVQRGITLHYYPSANLRSVLVCFSRKRGKRDIISHLGIQGIPATIFDDKSWPLHRDTMIGDNRILSVSLRNGSILLDDGVIKTVNEAINEFKNLL